jgi:hypothetical protein
MSIPVVGQAAQFHPSTYGLPAGTNPSPQPAVVTHVWGPSCVNLEVTLGNGEKSYPTSVSVVTPGYGQPSGYFCTLEAAPAAA